MIQTIHTGFWVRRLPSSQNHFSVPVKPSFQAAPFFTKHLNRRCDGACAHTAWAQLPKSSGSNPMNPQRKKPQIFTKKTGPAVNCHFLVVASAWPLRAQCTQCYNVITQAGTHGEDSHLGRHTPGAERHKGHSKAEVTRIYVFSRGGLKYNFNEDCIIDYCLRKLWQRTKESLYFPKGAFSSTGVERNGRKEKAAASVF